MLTRDFFARNSKDALVHYLLDDAMLEPQVLEDGFDDDVALAEQVVVGGGDDVGHEPLSLHSADLLSLHLGVDAGLDL